MNIKDILTKIEATQAPLARQLLMTGLITRRLADRGKPAPILIGGLALSYYTREVYFTADIDLAYSDREAMDEVLTELGFEKRGRYWVHPEAEVAVEVPASALAGEEAPRETVELEYGLFCVVIGLEDLIIDRLIAGKRWKSDIDCEMTELLTAAAKRPPASPLEMLLLRDRMGLRRYRKTARRDPEKRKLLLELAIKRIAKAEQSDYIPVGFRRRRVLFPAR